jgi:hypothetical protein
MHALHELWESLAAVGALWVFGAVLLALAGERMRSLEVEVVERPMRTFALGVVGLIVAIAAVLLLCVTLIGIPFAVIGVLFAVLFGYAGVCAVLTALGAILLNHRSSSPYLHLAAGAGLYLVASSIPWIGEYVTLTLALFGIGVTIATRGAGLLQRQLGKGDPYRTAMV